MLRSYGLLVNEHTNAEFKTKALFLNKHKISVNSYMQNQQK